MQKYSDIEHETIFVQMKLLIIPAKWLYFSSFSYLIYTTKKWDHLSWQVFFLCGHPDIPTAPHRRHRPPPGDGVAYSADNRRLWTFKHCGMTSKSRAPVAQVVVGGGVGLSFFPPGTFRHLATGKTWFVGIVWNQGESCLVGGVKWWAFYSLEAFFCLEKTAVSVVSDSWKKSDALECSNLKARHSSDQEEDREGGGLESAFYFNLRLKWAMKTLVG